MCEVDRCIISRGDIVIFRDQGYRIFRTNLADKFVAVFYVPKDA